MPDFFSQLDPLFTVALVTAMGKYVHNLASYTQDSHGKTRPFVALVSVGLGLLVTILYMIFGQEAILMLLGKFAQVAVGVFVTASTIWVFTHKVVSGFNVKTTVEKTSSTTTTVEPGIAVEPIDKEDKASPLS